MGNVIFLYFIYNQSINFIQNFNNTNDNQSENSNYDNKKTTKDFIEQVKINFLGNNYYISNKNVN